MNYTNATIFVKNDTEIVKNNTAYPLCVYYNTTTNKYESDGCYVLSSTKEYAWCACLHTTFFGLNKESLSLNVSYVFETSFRQLTWHTVGHNPLGIIVVICWMTFCAILAIVIELCSRYNILSFDDRPLVINKEIIFRNVVENDDHYKQHRIVQELDILTDDNLSLCPKVFKIWIQALLNEHLWLGICCRQYGTHFSHSKRIAIMKIR